MNQSDVQEIKDAVLSLQKEMEEVKMMLMMLVSEKKKTTVSFPINQTSVIGGVENNLKTLGLPPISEIVGTRRKVEKLEH